MVKHTKDIVDLYNQYLYTSLQGLANEITEGYMGQLIEKKINKYFQSVSDDLPQTSSSTVNMIDNTPLPSKYTITTN